MPRTFKLTPSHMTGEDIRTFQRDINKRFKAWDIDLRIDPDGDYGSETRQAAKQVCIGLGILHETAMKNGVDPQLQAKISDPDKRTAAEKQRGQGAKAKEFRTKLRKRSKAGLAGVRITETPGAPHWGGSNDVMRAFVEPFMVKRGLTIGSGKRTPAQNLAVGGSNTSDHLTTKSTTAARDFPTSAGEDDARALAQAMGFAAWQPNSHAKFIAAVNGNKFRVQILWGSVIEHDDHVHVGISPA